VFVTQFALRLQRFEKTNEMLTNCNSLSMSHLKTTSHELKKHTQMLTELRKDLDSTFKRISTIKAKINSQYSNYQKGKNVSNKLQLISGCSFIIN